MRRAIASARRRGHRSILLVGDASYYARFGFSTGKTGGLWLPGPYERHRLLGLELVEGGLDGARGLVSASGRKAPKQLRRTGRRPRARRRDSAARSVNVFRIPKGRANMNAMIKATTAWPLHARLRRSYRHDRIRLHRQGNVAPAGAAHRVRSRKVRGDRAGCEGSAAARRPPASLRPQGDNEARTTASADPAAHRRPGARHDRKSFGRYRRRSI